jgi:hypothetical protein
MIPPARRRRQKFARPSSTNSNRDIDTAAQTFVTVATVARTS